MNVAMSHPPDRTPPGWTLPAPRILIAGVGNELLSDDGVGIYAVRALQEDPLPGVTLAEIGTAVLHGLDFLDGADRVLVIDAARGGRPPGTLYLFEAADNSGAEALTSVHAMGLREAARLLYGKPVPPITILGVEPESLAYGMGLSHTVQAALPRAVSLARKTVAAWRQYPLIESCSNH
jgi:hydrogenase maturation protease